MRTKISLGAHSTTVDDYAQYNKAYNAADLDDTQNELDFAQLVSE